MTENKTKGILLYNKLSSENNLFLKFLTEDDENPLPLLLFIYLTILGILT